MYASVEEEEEEEKDQGSIMVCGSIMHACVYGVSVQALTSSSIRSMPYTSMQNADSPVIYIQFAARTSRALPHPFRVLELAHIVGRGINVESVRGTKTLH